MIETLAALLLAHILADFALQPGWMAAGKRHPGTLLAHGAIVLALAMAATGHVARIELLALAGAHVVIDGAKAWLPRARGALGFLGDQALHGTSLVALALWAPDLWAAGLWGALPAPVQAGALHGAVMLAAFLLSIQGGRYVVALLMRDLNVPADAPADGLPQGGMVIGLLERALITALILAGQSSAIGFLIAAKSILRFGAVQGTAQESRAASEYVIIGTLASFGWAILVALGAEAILGVLPALEIGAPHP